MKVSFTKDFVKQLTQIRDKKLAASIQEAIKNAEQVKTPWEIKSIKNRKVIKLHTAFVAEITGLVFSLKKTKYFLPQ